MAGNAATNRAKRDLMSRVMAEKRKQGWTTAQLATWLGVNPGTINSWARGASMGSNALRAILANMGTPAEEKPRIMAAADAVKRDADICERAITDALAAGADHIARFHQSRAEYYRARAVALFAMASNI